MQMHVQRLSQPLGDPAAFAAVFFQAGVQEPSLEVRPVGPPSGHEEALQRHLPGARDDVAAPNRSVPRVATEAEALQTLGHGEAVLINCLLDSVPVMATSESRIGPHPQQTNVIGDG
jgi:hypothetical protein